MNEDVTASEHGSSPALRAQGMWRIDITIWCADNTREKWSDRDVQIWSNAPTSPEAIIDAMRTLMLSEDEAIHEIMTTHVHVGQDQPRGLSAAEEPKG